MFFDNGFAQIMLAVLVLSTISKQVLGQPYLEQRLLIFRHHFSRQLL